MIKGIGIDLVEMERMQEIIDSKSRFIQKVLTEREQMRFNELKGKRQCEYLAGRFACKEAFSKAYGTGIGKLTLQDIEILSGAKGQPVVTRSPYKGRVHVTISHTEVLAIGQIILEEAEDQKS